MNTVIMDAVLYQALLEGRAARSDMDFREFSATLRASSAEYRVFLRFETDQRLYLRLTLLLPEPDLPENKKRRF